MKLTRKTKNIIGSTLYIFAIVFVTDAYTQLSHPNSDLNTQLVLSAVLATKAAIAQFGVVSGLALLSGQTPTKEKVRDSLAQMCDIAMAPFECGVPYGQ
jgi:hypothetical protein